MADDAPGTGGDDGGERHASSTHDPDATPSSDDRPVDDQPVDDHEPWNRDDDEYRVPLDLSENDETAADEDDAEGDEDDPYAPEPNSTPIEPGDPDLESAVFVLLGAVAMTLVLFRVMTLPL